LIKYILFVEIFGSILREEVNETELKTHINVFIRIKNEEKIAEFNKKFMRFIKSIS
jgi:predicted nucleotidyltransferase